LLNSFLIDPYSFSFMQDALLLSITISVSCALFSCLLVLKGWSLLGDATSHAVLPGIALAYLIKLPIIFGAFIAALFCTLLSSFIKNNSRIKEDTILGVVFSGMFALGIIMVSQIESDLHLMHLLFGNILGISNSDFNISIAICFMSSILFLIKRKDFTLYCFDPIHSHTINISIKGSYLLLLTSLCLTIVASVKSSGVILATAMLILPGAASFLLSKSISKMFIIASSIALICSYIGLTLSYHIDAQSAACIVLSQSVVFFLCFILKKIKRV